MIWNDKRYHTLDYELKQTFGEKVIKLSLDGGFTCPTRDGSLGKRGCIFCGEQGSGDFAGSHTLSLQEQIKQQRELLKRKWHFTNTYGPVERLDQLYGEALQADDLVGLAIATRPDCIGSPVMEKSPRATS